MQKEITDNKTLYLVKTLSRTKRKDYENYIINAVWQKLDNSNIEIITQQYIEDKLKNSHYFIDLYFPQLNIGIECDEAFHKKQLNKDKEREISIYDIINRVKNDSFELIRIDATQTFDNLQLSINNAVERIKQRILEVNPEKWIIETSEEYFRLREEINTSDKKGFNSINKTCNVLFNAGRNEESKGASRAYFSLPKFKGTYLENYKIWFPHLAMETVGKNGNIKKVAATKSGWNNQLINEGETIVEHNENNRSYKQDGKKRIVFLKYKDPLGFNEYKFVGIFEFEKIVKKKVYFSKISDNCKILRD